MNDFIHSLKKRRKIGKIFTKIPRKSLKNALATVIIKKFDGPKRLVALRSVSSGPTAAVSTIKNCSNDLSNF